MINFKNQEKADKIILILQVVLLKILSTLAFLHHVEQIPNAARLTDKEFVLVFQTTLVHLLIVNPNAFKIQIAPRISVAKT